MFGNAVADKLRQSSLISDSLISVAFDPRAVTVVTEYEDTESSGKLIDIDEE